MNSNSLIWCGKRNFSQSARHKNICDITVKTSVSNSKTKGRFIIRNGAASIISETDYIQFSVVNNRNVKRIYFMTGDHNTGLKMTSQDSMVSDNRYVQINKSYEAELLLDFIGDYELKYDNENDLYFVEK